MLPGIESLQAHAEGRGRFDVRFGHREQYTCRFGKTQGLRSHFRWRLNPADTKRTRHATFDARLAVIVAAMIEGDLERVA